MNCMETNIWSPFEFPQCSNKETRPYLAEKSQESNLFGTNALLEIDATTI